MMTFLDSLLRRRAISTTTQLDAAAIRRLGEIGQYIARLAHPDPSQRDEAETVLTRKGLTAVDPIISALKGHVGPLDDDARQRSVRVLRSTLTSERRQVRPLPDARVATLVEALAPLAATTSLRPELMPVLAQLGTQLLGTASAKLHYGGPSERQMRRAAAALGRLGDADIGELFGDRTPWVRLVVELRALEVDRTVQGFKSVLRKLATATEPSLQLVGHYYGDQGEVDLDTTMSGVELAEVLARKSRRDRSVTIWPDVERQVGRWSETGGTYLVGSQDFEWAGTMPTCLSIGGGLVWRTDDDEYLVWGLP